jgi:hypothetical protein
VEDGDGDGDGGMGGGGDGMRWDGDGDGDGFDRTSLVPSTGSLAVPGRSAHLSASGHISYQRATLKCRGSAMVL